MAVRKYGVLDEQGYKINSILIEESALGTDYYPGYGAKLIDEGPIEEEPKAPPPPPKPVDFGVLEFVLTEPMDFGDQIDFKTGEVTKKPNDKPVDEIPVDTLPVVP